MDGLFEVLSRGPVANESRKVVSLYVRVICHGAGGCFRPLLARRVKVRFGGPKAHRLSVTCPASTHLFAALSRLIDKGNRNEENNSHRSRSFGARPGIFWVRRHRFFLDTVGPEKDAS